MTDPVLGLLADAIIALHDEARETQDPAIARAMRSEAAILADVQTRVRLLLRPLRDDASEVTP